MAFRLHRPGIPLPSREDFGFGLDQTAAWRNFGNVTLTDAYARFLESPEHYQEDFMWMDSPAFAYYFPVIDKYLREIKIKPGAMDRCPAWVLGCDVMMQFD